jgi:RNase P protein component
MISCIVASSVNGIYVVLTSDSPNNICNTGIIVAKEKSDNTVERILKKRLAITCHRYGGKKRRKREIIFILFYEGNATGEYFV